MPTITTGVECPSCSGKTEVKETRGGRRRRRCLQCSYEYKTNEIIETTNTRAMIKELEELREFRSSIFNLFWPQIEQQIINQANKST